MPRHITVLIFQADITSISIAGDGPLINVAEVEEATGSMGLAHTTATYHVSRMFHFVGRDDQPDLLPAMAIHLTIVGGRRLKESGTR